MDIPGIVAKHAVITDACREGRGEEGAIDEALARIRQEYLSTILFWQQNKGAKFHVVLTVETPATGGKG